MGPSRSVSRPTRSKRSTGASKTRRKSTVSRPKKASKTKTSSRSGDTFTRSRELSEASAPNRASSLAESFSRNFRQTEENRATGIKTQAGSGGARTLTVSNPSKGENRNGTASGVLNGTSGKSDLRVSYEHDKVSDADVKLINKQIQADENQAYDPGTGAAGEVNRATHDLPGAPTAAGPEDNSVPRTPLASDVVIQPGGSGNHLRLDNPVNVTGQQANHNTRTLLEPGENQVTLNQNQTSGANMPADIYVGGKRLFSTTGDAKMGRVSHNFENMQGALNFNYDPAFGGNFNAKHPLASGVTFGENEKTGMNTLRVSNQ